MITLDGRSSQCSDGEIESWEWRDSAGLPIGNSSALKVRLKPGTHQFTLSILSSKGMASSDSVSIQIMGDEDSDDSFDVLLE